MQKQSQTVAGQFSTLKDNFQQMSGSLFKGASETLGKKALPILIGWVDKLTKAFEEEGIDGFLNALGEILGEGLSFITDALPDIAEMGFNILCSLVDGILENVDEMAEAGITLIEVLVEGIAEFLPKFANTGTQFILKLIEGFGQALPSLISTIVQLAIDLVNILISNIPLFVQAGISLFEGLLQGILDALPTLLEALPEIIVSLVEALLEQIPVIIDAGVQLLTALVDNLPLIIDTIVAVLPQIIDGIINALIGDDGDGSNLSKIIQAGVKLFVALIQNIDDIVLGIVGAIPELISGIVGAIVNGDTLADMAEAGVELIYGLLSGLKSAWDEVVGWVESAVNWIGDKFGIGGGSEADENLPTAARMGASNLTGGTTSGRGNNNTTRSSVGGTKIGGYADGGIVPKGHIAFLEGYGDEAVVPLHNNQKWISAVAKDMTSAIGGGNLSSLESKFDRLIEIVQRSSGNKIYLDTGVLVGELTPDIDASLGEVDNLRRRGG